MIGTTFHFVTEGVQVALERARSAAEGKDVRLGGGGSTIRQYLQARLIDEMPVAITFAHGQSFKRIGVQVQ